MEEIAIKIDHVSKEYRLGAIGGGTLRGDLQSWMARIRGKEDPNTLIGTDTSARIGERFKALDEVSFEVKKGEAVGIIGHNGAGKSTLLKLLSRVTAPTQGTISYNGRIASMLEVGTGFHPELTGRENVYMNGAILGMTKAEIEKKFDQIVDFAEMRQFVDTPVKRYSSGMYVKLAFSVAAHLDSEIMIMDEVLAVGDMKFQQKCLNKMKDAATLEGKTVLYVSHNMNTIRQLCERCIVLDHGKVIFQGDVEEAISIYLGTKGKVQDRYVYSKEFHSNGKSDGKFVIESLEIQNRLNEEYISGDNIEFLLNCHSEEAWNQVKFRFEIQSFGDAVVGTMLTDQAVDFCVKERKCLKMMFDTTHLAPGKYSVDIIAYVYNQFGAEQFLDGVYPGIVLEISDKITEDNQLIWLHKYWGHIHLQDVKIV